MSSRASSESPKGPPEGLHSGKSLGKLLGAGLLICTLPVAYWLGSRSAKNHEAPERSASIREPASVPHVASPASPIQPEITNGAHLAAAAEPTPVEAAPPPNLVQPQISALEHRDRVLAALRASGRDTRLTPFAQTVVKGWAHKLQQLGIAGKVEPLECYAKGCAVSIVYPAKSAAENGNEVVTRSGEFNGWQSGKMRSGYIEKDNGQVEVTWILDSPPASGPVLPEKLPEDNFDELKEQLARVQK